MAKKRTPGLYKRKGVWHIDKQLFGQRFCESTGAASLAEAELVLAKRIEEIRQLRIFGVRPIHTFDEAAKKYVSVKKSKISIRKDIKELKRLHDYLANEPLEAIHMGNVALVRFIESRREEGVKNRTLNYALQVLRHLLKLAAEEWRDEKGNAWLLQAPKIKLLPLHDARKPRPISWEEQKRFFIELPPLLREMALFAVNTGCRDQEICQLQWQWEVPVSELDTSVFILPGWYHREDSRLVKFTKNGEDRLVVLNKVAKAVVDRQRGNHCRYVFAHRRQGEMRPYYSMNNTGWQSARKRVGIADIRVHDLRHTFGRRLRSAGVNYEDRQDLLGHKSERITTHYSSAEISDLISAVNLICESRTSAPTLTVLRGLTVSPAKLPQGSWK